MKTETEPKTEKYGKWKPKNRKPKLIWFGSVFSFRLKLPAPTPSNTHDLSFGYLKGKLGHITNLGYLMVHGGYLKCKLESLPYI